MLTSPTEKRTALAPAAPLVDFMAALLFMMLTSVLGIKRFEAWSQVLFLWDSKVSPILLVGHPHFFRFLVAYPGFMLENLYAEAGFSLYISVFFAINLVLWKKISYLCLNRKPVFLATFLFIVLHFFMNGRGVIAWTGWLLAVWLCLQFIKGNPLGWKHLGLVVVACWIAAVSTGVFVVVVVALLGFYMTSFRTVTLRPARIVLAVVVGGPLLFEVMSYFWMAVNKNVNFYGGGLSGAVNMLHHGLGAIFFGSELVLLGLLLGAGVSASALLALVLFGVRLSPLATLTLIATAGGLFGFTVLTLALPLVLLTVPRFFPAKTLK